VGFYFNSVGVLGHIFIVSYSYQTCFDFLGFVVNYVIGCVLHDHEVHITLILNSIKKRINPLTRVPSKMM